MSRSSLSIYWALRCLPPKPPHPHPHKLTPEPALSSLLKWISHPDITKTPLSLEKRERLLPEHSGFCSFKSPCVGRRRVKSGESRMLPTLGLTLGVDAWGRAGAAPNSPSFTHWLIPQIFVEGLLSCQALQEALYNHHLVEVIPTA